MLQAAVFVREGTANADRAFVCSNNSINLGSTALTFVGLASALGALLAASNLSDVANKTTAFNNVSPCSVKGDIVTHDGTNNVRLAVGSTNGMLVGAVASAAAWVDPPCTIVLHNSTNTAIAANSNFYGIESSGSTIARFIVPTGKTLYILGVSANWDTGAGSGPGRFATWAARMVRPRRRSPRQPRQARRVPVPRRRRARSPPRSRRTRLATRYSLGGRTTPPRRVRWVRTPRVSGCGES